MHARMEPGIKKWPFFVGDLLLLAIAGFFCFHSGGAAGAWEMSLAALCVISAAGFGAAPYILEYRASLRLAEADAVATVVSQVRDLEAIAKQIQSATGQWQTVQEYADKTTGAARQIAERMTLEVKGFAEFMEKVSDREKAALRLDGAKFR